MSLKNVCNEDMMVEFANTAGPGDLSYTGDQGIDLVKVVPTLSTKCKAPPGLSPKKVATEKVTITWTVATGGCAYTSASTVFVAGAAIVQTSATKTKAQGKIVLREGDTSLLGCVGSWTAAGPVAVPCACDIEIVDAGQTKAKAQ